MWHECDHVKVILQSDHVSFIMGVITLEWCDMGVIKVKYFLQGDHIVNTYDSHCQDNM